MNPRPQINAGAASRTDRFMARVDGHLYLLADDSARRVFLTKQIDGWQHRMAAWVASDGATEYAEDLAGDPIHINDFVLTIVALAARRALLGCEHD